MDGYLLKPVTRQTLRAALTQWIPAAAGEVEGRDRPEAGEGLRPGRLEEISGGDPALLVELLTGFTEAGAQALGRLEEALAAGDRIRLAGEAHGLCGICAMIGADDLAASCRHLEELGRQADPAEVVGRLARLRTAWEALRAELSGLLEEARRL
jgi:HPt (histidine-containing phosphotransfer) domain-containing protein